MFFNEIQKLNYLLVSLHVNLAFVIDYQIYLDTSIHTMHIFSQRTRLGPRLLKADQCKYHRLY